MRNKFRRNRNVHSTRLLKLSFTAGYELLDTLDRATTTPPTANPNAAAEATTLITSLLTTAPRHLTRSPYYIRPSKPTRLSPSPEACPPPHLSMLAVRPRPASALGGTGIRRIPRILSANTFPILRLSKPQPRSLSRIITDMVKQRQRRLNVRDSTLEWAKRGEMEDEWDRLLWDMHGVGDEDGLEPPPPPMPKAERGLDDDKDLEANEGLKWSWAWEARWLGRVVSWQMYQQRVRTQERVKSMQEIVDRETEMARKEREERRARRVAEGRRKKDFEEIVGRGGASKR